MQNPAKLHEMKIISPNFTKFRTSEYSITLEPYCRGNEIPLIEVTEGG